MYDQLGEFLPAITTQTHKSAQKLNRRFLQRYKRSHKITSNPELLVFLKKIEHSNFWNKLITVFFSCARVVMLGSNPRFSNPEGELFCLRKREFGVTNAKTIIMLRPSGSSTVVSAQSGLYLQRPDSPKLSYIEFTLRKRHSPPHKKQTIQKSCWKIPWFRLTKPLQTSILMQQKRIEN